MNSVLIIAYGIAGLFFGFVITFVAHRIISYKCEQLDRKVKESRIDGRLFQIVICICNGVAWSLVASIQLKPFSGLLISILFSLAVLFTIIDIRIHVIPNELVLVTLAVGAIFQLIQFGGKSLLIAVASSLGMMFLFALVGFIIGLDKVGAGDVKLAGVMGMVLGYPLIVTAVLTMSLAMITYCVIGISIRKLTFVSMFPFAPFMMLGMVISLGSIILSEWLT